MASADLAGDLEPQRSYLLRVARLQLRDEALAEDVVQETLLAALAGSGFSGKSTLRTWLTGILKHKIVDAIRKKQREPTVASAFGDVDSEMDIEDFDAMFNERGGWDPKPADWGNPEDALNQRQFLDVMDICLEKLPPNTARVFMSRPARKRYRKEPPIIACPTGNPNRLRASIVSNASENGAGGVHGACPASVAASSSAPPRSACQRSQA